MSGISARISRTAEAFFVPLAGNVMSYKSLALVKKLGVVSVISKTSRDGRRILQSQ